MEEVEPLNGLYTKGEFDQAVTDNKERQDSAVEDYVNTMKDIANENNGLSPEESQQIDTITLMRIYDLLGALLTRFDEQTATAILEAHAEGRLIGPLPALKL